jgi:hypothetical protein
MTKKEREQRAKARPLILKEVVRLEQLYGESAVSGAYNRHRAVRAAQRKLARQRAEIDAKIAKLRA